MDGPVGTKKKTRTYKQFAALPYTVRDGQLLVMLVTSRETGRWVIPKGWPEKNMAGRDITALEAFEEAGLKGEVARKPLAAFVYSKRMSETKRRRCRVEVFLLAIHQELDEWPEKDQAQTGMDEPDAGGDAGRRSGFDRPFSWFEVGLISPPSSGGPENIHSLAPPRAFPPLRLFKLVSRGDPSVQAGHMLTKGFAQFPLNFGTQGFPSLHVIGSGKNRYRSNICYPKRHMMDRQQG